MRVNMGAAVIDGVAAGLTTYGQWSRGGYRDGGHPPVAPVLSCVAQRLMGVFQDTGSRAFITIDTPYAVAITASAELSDAMAAATPPVLDARAGLMVWNHRELPRGALEMLRFWDDNAVMAALGRLSAFTHVCGPDTGGTVRYGLLGVLSSVAFPPDDIVRRLCRAALSDGGENLSVRLHTSEPVAWSRDRSVQGLVIELLTRDAPTPCQQESGTAH